MRRRHTIVSNTQAAPVRGRSERSGKGRSRGPVGETFWSRGRPSGAVCAGADAAALGRACRLRLPWRCRSCFSFPFLSLVFSGWFTWWVNGGGRKAGAGRYPHILLRRPRSGPARPSTCRTGPRGPPCAPLGLGSAGASASLRQQDQRLLEGLRFCPGFSPPIPFWRLFSLSEKCFYSVLSHMH